VSGDGDVRPTDEYANLYGAVQRSAEAGRNAVRPGVAAEDIDRASRGVIADAGLGEYFIHRTGHGIGLEGHEDPYLVEGNADELVPGNAFSVEPGVYFDGRYGARIEDIVVCTTDGGDTLNQAPRDLLVVRG
jgi:Xaa-Pro dipeptidase